MPCPNCGQSLDCSSGVAEHQKEVMIPKDQDITMCIVCGEWLQYVGEPPTSLMMMPPGVMAKVDFSLRKQMALTRRAWLMTDAKRRK
jgi:hypothetical protein